MVALQSRQLIPALDRFSQQKVLVVGDIMVDEYLWGSVNRISPEAPVQIIEVKRQEFRLGGCGNVVNNLSSFNPQIAIACVVGNDSHHEIIMAELKRLEVDTQSLLIDPLRPTTKKTRALASGQQIVRIDFEKRDPLQEKDETTLIRFIQENVENFNIFVLSDYGKGVLTPRVLSSIIEIGRRFSIPTIVDPKGKDFSKYRNATLITPNSLEAETSTGIEIRDDFSAEDAGQKILQAGNHKAVLITRGKRGMTLLESGQESAIHIPTIAKEVFDVSGAGDTVLSVLALGISSGISYKEACTLANYAGGIVVGKLGTSAVTKQELISFLKKNE